MPELRVPSSTCLCSLHPKFLGLSISWLQYGQLSSPLVIMAGPIEHSLCSWKLPIDVILYWFGPSENQMSRQY